MIQRGDGLESHLAASMMVALRRSKELQVGGSADALRRRKELQADAREQSRGGDAFEGVQPTAASLVRIDWLSLPDSLMVWLR